MFYFYFFTMVCVKPACAANNFLMVADDVQVLSRVDTHTTQTLPPVGHPLAGCIQRTRACPDFLTGVPIAAHTRGCGVLFRAGTRYPIPGCSTGLRISFRLRTLDATRAPIVGNTWGNSAACHGRLFSLQLRALHVCVCAGDSVVTLP